MVAMALSLAPAASRAQEAGPAAPEASDPAAAPSGCCTIPARTLLEIEIVDRVSSKLNRPGDRFAIRLAEPVLVDGNLLIPAGIRGEGEVVHAAKGGAGGKGGELILAARFLDLDGVRIPLRSFRYGPSQGHDKTKTVNTMNVAAAAFVPALAFAGLFISGGNVDIPAGTRANAQTAEQLAIAPPAAPAQ
jgi:hypothetical protein